MKHLNDNGYGSRKLHMAYAVMAQMMVGFFLAAKYPELAAVYPTLCMGLVGAAGLYVGGNVWGKQVLSKVPLEPQQPPQ